MRRNLTAGWLRVFISSGIDEYKQLRKYVADQLNRKSLLPPYEAWIYELAPAEDSDPRPLYLTELANSDYVAFIIGKDLNQGVEEEYAEAERLGKPRLIFVQDVEHSRGCAKFIRRLNKERHYNTWTSRMDLWDAIKTSLANQTSRRHRELTGTLPPANQGLTYADTPYEYQLLAKHIGALCDQGAYTQAKAELDEGFATASESTKRNEYKNLIAYTLRRSGKIEEALTIYRQLNKETGHPRFLLSQIIALLTDDRIDAAQTLYDALPASAESLPVYHLLGAQLAAIAGNEELALRRLTPIRNRKNRERIGYDFYMVFGMLASRASRHKYALKAFRKAAQVHPSSRAATLPSQALHLMEISRLTGDPDLIQEASNLLSEAKVCYRQTMLPRLSDSDEFQTFLGTVEVAVDLLQGRRDEALEQLSQLAAKHPDSALFQYNLANLRYSITGEPPPDEILKAAVNETDDRSIWFNYIGKFLQSAAQKEVVSPETSEAVSSYKSKFPGDPAADYFDGCIAIAEGRLDEAAALLDRAITNRKSSQLVKLNAINYRAMLEANRGRFDEVARIFDTAAESGLLNFDLVGTMLEVYTNLHRGGPGNSVYAKVMKILRLVPHVVKLETSRGGVLHLEVLAKVAQSGFRASKGVSDPKEYFEVNDRIISSLPEPSRSIYLAAMAQAMV